MPDHGPNGTKRWAGPEFKEPAVDEVDWGRPSYDFREVLSQEVCIVRITWTLRDGPHTARELKAKLCSEKFPDARLYVMLGHMESMGMISQDGTYPVHYSLLEGF